MYKSFDFKFIRYNIFTDKFIYEITINDDNFTEITQQHALRSVATTPLGLGNDSWLTAQVIIKVYSKRKLNVAKNLFLYMKDAQTIYSSVDIKYLIECYSSNIPEFKQYVPEINKYFLFS